MITVFLSFRRTIIPTICLKQKEVELGSTKSGDSFLILVGCIQIGAK